MNRGDVILVRFPHPSGARGKKRPAVVVQSDIYNQSVKTVIVAEVSKNLKMATDAACLFIDVNTADGRATGLMHNSVVSCLLLATIDRDRVDQVLGSLSAAMNNNLNGCLKTVFGISY
jgi:mRNA-degrading endonuclease toxin of MazEF toxin-antitoxin module